MPSVGAVRAKHFTGAIFASDPCDKNSGGSLSANSVQKYHPPLCVRRLCWVRVACRSPRQQRELERSALDVVSVVRTSPACNESRRLTQPARCTGVSPRSVAGQLHPTATEAVKCHMKNSDSHAFGNKPAGRMVACPNCGHAIRWSTDNPFRPFCSERCKLIDLGRWASEQYRVPVESEPEGAEFPDDHQN